MTRRKPSNCSVRRAIPTVLRCPSLPAASRRRSLWGRGPDTARDAQYQTGGWKNGLLVGAITTGGDTAPKWLQSVNGQLAETLATQISLKRAPGGQTLLTQALTA